jgi:hypothetical protein
MPSAENLRFAHELDAAWIIALWLAIHGGDPDPDKVAAEAIAALEGTLTKGVLSGATVSGATLAGRMGNAAAEASLPELQARLREIGVDFQHHPRAYGEAVPVAESPIPRTYCVVYGGQRICFTLRPSLAQPRLWRESQTAG